MLSEEELEELKRAGVELYAKEPDYRKYVTWKPIPPDELARMSRRG